MISRDKEFYEGQNYRKHNLPNQLLKIEKMCSVLKKDQSDAVVQNINFHSNSEIFLTSGFNKLIKIFNISHNPQDNIQSKIKLLKNVYLEGLPIKKAAFLN